jgi:hypothetical protein
VGRWDGLHEADQSGAGDANDEAQPQVCSVCMETWYGSAYVAVVENKGGDPKEKICTFNKKMLLLDLFFKKKSCL